MVVFLARGNIQTRRLHKRIKNRFQSDGLFTTVQFRPAQPREPGPYRVTAETNPQTFLDDDSYPVTDTRIEVGFDIATDQEHDFYWLNWIEPRRSLLLGWHQDNDHSDLGPAHMQVVQHGDAIEHRPATVLNKHPLAVLDARLNQLPAVLASIEWDAGTAVSLGW